MTKRYLGNIITDTPTEPAGPYQNDAASGVWSLAEAFAYTKAGLWPIAGNEKIIWYGDRGVMAGGYQTNYVNVIEYVTITSAGNAIDFGDLTQTSRSNESAVSNGSRGVFANLYNGGASNVIDYITIASTGNATDFGDAYYSTINIYAVSDGVKGYIAGGNSAGIDISTITIATTGNAVDWGGDVPYSTYRAGAATGSSTRGLFMGGLDAVPNYLTNIYYITYASVGNMVSFGDLSTGVYYNNSTGSDTRALSIGGTSTGGYVQAIEYITIATTGNAVSFGNLQAGSSIGGATSNNVTGIYAGGYDGVQKNGIQQFTISTTGNTTTFGNLSTAKSGCATTSGN